MLCAAVKAVTHLHELQGPVHEEEQADDEQDVIESEQQVLDAEQQVVSPRGSGPGIRTSYRSRSVRNAVRFCSRRRASQQILDDPLPDIVERGRPRRPQTQHRTRCAPCAETIGPCQSPVSMSRSAVTKSAPNSSAISWSVRSAYSLSSMNGSPARLQPPSSPPRTARSSAPASRRGSDRPVGAQIDVPEGGPVRLTVPLGVRGEVTPPPRARAPALPYCPPA